jgi:hypothetical protein
MSNGLGALSPVPPDKHMVDAVTHKELGRGLMRRIVGTDVDRYAALCIRT